LFNLADARAELRDLPQLTILSTASLSTVLTDISRTYSSEKEITVTTSFDAGPEQADRIISGNAADVFISSHPTWMDAVKQKGLVDVHSITNLFSNELCVTSSIYSAASKQILAPGNSLTELFDLVLERAFIVIGDPAFTSLGIYTLQTLAALDIEKKVLSRAIRAGSAENAYLIAQGRHAGILFCSDLIDNKELVRLATIPSNLHDPIVYQAAAVAGENMALARDFINYLKKPETQKIFQAHGFVVE
jgi:molybdate transport system substrate-binding protein